MIEPNRTVTVEPENPSNPSLGPDPLAFENNVIPRLSNALDGAFDHTMSPAGRDVTP